MCFNRAVAASQSFGRQFPDLDKLLRERQEHACRGLAFGSSGVA